MKILLSVGHSWLKNGYYTSADGRPFGGVLEYEYNKNIVTRIASYLELVGHKVKVFIQPEKVYTKSTQEKAPKILEANGSGYDLVAELHLNASALHNARGCEVIYNGVGNAQEVAGNVLQSLSRAFQKRKAYPNNSLYMMNSVKVPSIIIESFFCDNSVDCKIANETNVALLIAEGIHGHSITGAGEEKENKDNKGYLFRIRTIVESLNIRKGPGAEYDKVGAITDHLVYTIVETQKAKDGGTWGRLKSGAGWINVSGHYVNKV